MKLLIFHPVKLPVLQYGGTERVVMWLAQTLAKMGHEITVFAAPGSSMPPGIECMTDPAVLKARAKDFDVLHGFSRIDPEIETEVEGRVLITIQGNGQVGETFHRNTVFVSRNHAKRHGAEAFVYNGLDPDELSFSDKPRPNRFLFLSKTSWRVKNLKGAARIASKHGQNLWIAGGDSPYSLRAKCAMKRMLGQDWNWTGSVNQEQKAKFLVEGKAMLFPLLWNEPFGIVMTESLVSGTPVFAHPYGSVPEVLEFAPQCLLKTEDDWMRAVTGGIPLPSPKQCRDWVLSRFDQVTMAKSYLKLYEKVANGQALNPQEPQTLIGAEDLISQPFS
jgi:glycosyltransferase involved in cell wall biosynthesis